MSRFGWGMRHSYRSHAQRSRELCDAGEWCGFGLGGFNGQSENSRSLVVESSVVSQKCYRINGTICEFAEFSEPMINQDCLEADV